MQVRQRTFLEEGNKKITLFFIVPEIGQELTAKSMVHQTALEYVIEHNVSYNKFIDPDNPFTVLILEGINNR